MFVDILIALLLLFDSAGMAYLGVHVTFKPVDSPKKQRAYQAAFVLCTLIAAGLLAWQVVRNSIAQEHLNERVDILYRLQATSVTRPTTEEIAALTNRANRLRRDNRHDLKSELQLLSADIFLFVAERSAASPQQELGYYFKGPQIAEMVEMMNRPLNTDAVTVEEEVEWGHRLWEESPADFSLITPNEQDSLWVERNWPSIEYYYQTRILFGKKFGKRICDVVYNTDCHCGLTDPEWNEYVRDSAALRLAERPVYAGMKQWLSTGKKPANLDALVKVREKVMAQYLKATVIKKVMNNPVGKVPPPSLHVSVASSIAQYPTNLIAMRTLAQQMKALTDEMP